MSPTPPTPMEKLEFFSAIVLVSKDTRRLAAFYRDTLGLPLEEEIHPDSDVHYACEVGDIHFAIFPEPQKHLDRGARVGHGQVKFAFTVFDLDAMVKALRERGVEVTYAPMQAEDFIRMTAIRDPDGNYIELTQMDERWFKHLASRKRQGIDVVHRWKERTGSAQPAPAETPEDGPKWFDKPRPA
jgi:predicted enzyme related to lactoylglutathione lyase